MGLIYKKEFCVKLLRSFASDSASFRDDKVQRSSASDSASFRDGNGFATLVSLLLVGVIGLAISTSLILLGVSSSRTSFSLEQSYQAKGLSDACAEEGLQRIRDTSSFTGSATLILGQGSCAYAVTSQGGGNRTITASSTVSGTVRRTKVIIDAVSPSINIASWQEVADF